MPEYQSRVDKARRLIALTSEVQSAREAEEAAQQAIARAEGEGSPPELVVAHRVLAEEANEQLVALEREYEELKKEFTTL
jgi:regulator of protease activity HflC (stomatin/prohibitin superfamily)